MPPDIESPVAGTVTVSGPRRTISVSGIGARDRGSEAQSRGDFAARCKMALEGDGGTLDKQRASLSDVVPVFVTRSRYRIG